MLGQKLQYSAKGLGINWNPAVKWYNNYTIKYNTNTMNH